MLDGVDEHCARAEQMALGAEPWSIWANRHGARTARLSGLLRTLPNVWKHKREAVRERGNLRRSWHTRNGPARKL